MLYFEQHESVPSRFRAPRAPDTGGDQGSIAAPLVVPFAEGWAIAPPQPNHPTPERRAAGIMPVEQGNEAVFAVFSQIGFPTQDPQPPALRYRQRHAGLFDSDVGDVKDIAPLIVPFRQGWENQPPQPPVPWRKPTIAAAALARGDDGMEAIFIAPWLFATPAVTFPDYQNRPEGAIPQWDAGAPVGALKSMPNITAPTVLKAAPGYVFSISVVVAGTTTGGLFDSPINNSANQVLVIPNTVGLIVVGWPCQTGILVIPGAGQTLAVKWT